VATDEWKGLRVALALLLVALTLQAQAQMKYVAPGKVPELGPDEGLVVMAMDSDMDLFRVRVTRDGRSFGGGVMNSPGVGRSFRLYQAPAGTYEWSDVKPVAGVSYRMDDDPELKFEVRPGRINYGGDLVFRTVGIWRASMRSANRGLAAIDWLHEQHPEVLRRYPFEYSGRYPDPFPAFYAAERAAHPHARPEADVAFVPPPASGPLPVPVETLWKSGQILQVSLNPSGSLMALHLQTGDEAWSVDLIDLEAGTRSTLAQSAAKFDELAWADNGTLLATISLPERGSQVTVIRILTEADGRRRYESIRVPHRGWVVDPLPDDPNHILFASAGRDGQMMVHRLDISSQKAVDKFQATMRTRLNQDFKDDVDWIADAQGRLRLAVVKGEEEYVLVRPGGEAQAEVMRLDGTFDPVGASADGGTIYGLTEEGRSQRDLVAWDVAGARIARTLFSREGVDVQAVLLDAGRNPMGVVYDQGGRRVSEYFQATDSHLADLLQRAFPDRTVTVGDRSHDGSQLALWVEAPDQPPLLYHLDTRTGVASLVEEDRPWLAGMDLAPTRLLRFRGRDGLPLEAFLTMPPRHSGARVPLVVFPHGGPVGVADRLVFDPEVQFLASLGYAVLQVNFRGSDGYGRAFREAAEGAFGTQIEDDIDAAIEHALANHPLDRSRMCMLGASYGGYSALFSAVRWPGRFRCVVSIAGLSDRILHFSASDSSQDPKLRERLEKLMGDPRRDSGQMRATSPLYRYAELHEPVMLAHGLDDARVDFEHTRRMLRMLDMTGRTPVGLQFADEGHSIREKANQQALWQGVAGFLRQHLEDAGTPGRD